MGSNAASGGGSNRYEPTPKKNPIVEFVKGGGFTGAILRGVTKAFKISPKEKTTDPNELYSDKPTFREGGNNDGNNNNNSNLIIPLKNTTTSATAIAPTTAEISQATATEADTTSIDNIETRKKKAKAKGRSMTILSSSRGVTSDENLILGKKSLLGQ